VVARIVPMAEVDASLTERWRTLGTRAVEPNPFVEPDFALPAGRWLAGSAPVGVLVVERGTELRIALPVARVRRFRGVPVRAVATWLHSQCPLGTPLVSPVDPEGAWAEALDLLRATDPLGILGLLGTGGEVARTLDAALGRRRAAATALTRLDRPVVRRRPEPTYLDELSGDRRKGLRRRARRLAAELGGDLAYVDHAAPGADLDGALARFLAMERAGWKGRDGGALACRPEHAAFFRAMCHGFASAGRLRLWALEGAGRPVAYQCCVLAGDTVFELKTAYDETLRRHAPGVLLALGMIDRFHADDRYDVLDSGTGTDATIAHELFPDRCVVADVLLPLPGLLGRAAAPALPAAVAAYRRVRARTALSQPGLDQPGLPAM
jgi:CelD/BcsL family acetyltransferase involved in cellulose biosynthesis